ncbi:hypothetical protein J1N35_005659 [Gossypium stocksii]|uniref:Uncharacterized protein n=1 Tax=Gossypium stocksii TaxID=47602 RepID=A0A9D3WEA4_9ROSI|nr:hypothetical protein J1N35_005659 [Gossypium stocksii]
MLQPSSKASYDKEFPSLEEYTEKNFTYAQKIPSKIQTDISSALAKISVAKATLNWQTENALAQNHTLKRIDSKISAIEAKVDDNTKMAKDLINLLQKRLDAVATELAALRHDFFSHLTQREKEIKNLKEQIKMLQETEQTKPRTYEVFQEINKQEVEKKKMKKATEVAEKEEAHQEEIKLSKRPIVDKSPPKSPPPKQASKSLMIRGNLNQNP